MTGSPPADERRWPRSVYGMGTEPDPRFSLANERTYLAWVRTALALYAAAIALQTLEVPEASAWRLGATCTLGALATLCATSAWLRWSAAERALRRRRPLPGLHLGPVVCGGVIVAAALAAIGAL